MTLHMPGIQGGRGGASTHKKTEIDHEVLMECPQGGEIQYFYGALGTLQLIKKALSTWKAFRSIFDQDHKSGQLCLSAHIPDWRRGSRKFLMGLLTFLRSVEDPW